MAFYKKHCIHCEALIDGDSVFCPSCARMSPFGYQCYTCGREINQYDKLCSGCGRALIIACPSCKEMVFMQDRCDKCGASLMIRCPNKRCQAYQFFDADKCTACGKKISINNRSTKKII